MPDISGYQNLGGVKGTAFDSNLPYVDPRKMAAAQENFARLQLMARLQQAQALANQQTRLGDRQIAAQERIQGTPERRASAEGTAQLALQGGSRRDLLADEIAGQERLGRSAADNQLRVAGGTGMDLARLQGDQALGLARTQGEFALEGQRAASAPGLLDAQSRAADREQQRGFATADRQVPDLVRQMLVAQLQSRAQPTGGGVLQDTDLRDILRTAGGLGPSQTPVQQAQTQLDTAAVQDALAQQQAGKQAVTGRLAEIQGIPVLAAELRRVRPTVGSDQEALAAVDARAGQIAQERAASLEKDLRRFVAQDAAWFGSDPGAQATQRIEAAVQELQALGAALGDPTAMQNLIREIVQRIVDEESAMLGREDATAALLGRIGLGDD